MSGAGSLMHMNVSMKQSRAIKTSNKQKFRSNDGGKIHSDNHAETLHFKEVPKEELDIIKNGIREKARIEQRKLIVRFIFIAMLVIALMLIVFI